MDSSSPTLDAIITGLGGIRAAMGREEDRQTDVETIQAAVNIISAFSEEGAKTADDALDILHDYRLQGKQYSALHRKHEVAGKAIFKDGVWHCPDCNGRTTPNHSFCHRCGKKLRWR